MVNYNRHIDLNVGNGFSFSRFCDISPKEFEQFGMDGIIFMWVYTEFFNPEEMIESKNWGNYINLQYNYPTIEAYAHKKKSKKIQFPLLSG
jgi:hypothetical protein